MVVLTRFHDTMPCVSKLEGVDQDPGLRCITPGRVRRVLPSNRSVPLDAVAADFHDWIDYNGVHFQKRY